MIHPYSLPSAILSIAVVACAEARDNQVGALEGTWETDAVTVTYFAEGYAVPVSKSAEKALGLLQATVVDGRVSLRNLTAPNGATPESTACSMSAAGTYKFVIESNTLTMQVIDDPCGDRADSVSSFVMNRVAASD